MVILTAVEGQVTAPNLGSTVAQLWRKECSGDWAAQVVLHGRLGARNTAHSPAVAKIVPAREFRTKLGELLSDVADRRDHVLVTRNGKPAAALVPIDEYEALEETADILSDQRRSPPSKPASPTLYEATRPCSASCATVEPLADTWPKSFLRHRRSHRHATAL